MSHDYTIGIENIHYHPEINGCPNVVKHVEWYINVFHVDNPDVTQPHFIDTLLDTDGVRPDSFTSWEDLTHTAILEWCLTSVGGQSFIDNILNNDDAQNILQRKLVMAPLFEADITEIPES